MTPSAVDSLTSKGTLPINGDDYAHTLFAATTSSAGFTEFTLGRDCATFEGTFGLSDRTETGGRATLQVRSDGALAYDRTFGLGESEAKSIDVSDVYRLRIDFAQVADTPVTEPAIGAGRVLCDGETSVAGEDPPQVIERDVAGDSAVSGVCAGARRPASRRTAASSGPAYVAVVSWMPGSMLTLSSTTSVWSPTARRTGSSACRPCRRSPAGKASTGRGDAGAGRRRRR